MSFLNSLAHLFDHNAGHPQPQQQPLPVQHQRQPMYHPNVAESYLQQRLNGGVRQSQPSPALRYHPNVQTESYLMANARARIHPGLAVNQMGNDQYMGGPQLQPQGYSPIQAPQMMPLQGSPGMQAQGNMSYSPLQARQSYLNFQQ